MIQSRSTTTITPNEPKELLSGHNMQSADINVLSELVQKGESRGELIRLSSNEREYVEEQLQIKLTEARKNREFGDIQSISDENENSVTCAFKCKYENISFDRVCKFSAKFVATIHERYDYQNNRPNQPKIQVYTFASSEVLQTLKNKVEQAWEIDDVLTILIKHSHDIMNKYNRAAQFSIFSKPDTIKDLQKSVTMLNNSIKNLGTNKSLIDININKLEKVDKSELADITGLDMDTRNELALIKLFLSKIDQTQKQEIYGEFIKAMKSLPENQFAKDGKPKRRGEAVHEFYREIKEDLGQLTKKAKGPARSLTEEEAKLLRETDIHNKQLKNQ